MFLFLLFWFFFFQAEDGIRDLVRSRGLGDVYKRQQTMVSNNAGKTVSDTSAQNNQSSTTNYEIGKTIERVVQGSGNITRLSVAAVINDIPKEVKKGDVTETVFEPRSQEQIKKLEELSGVSRDSAKKLLLDEVHNDLKGDIARAIQEADDEAKKDANKKSQEILVDAMRHGVLDYIAEYTVSVVRIEAEDIKGRIIGKEGRNIRAFETATGVDVDLDEEGVIRLSSFDSIRREIARLTLLKLIKDTRIQPFRIEELVEQTKDEMDRILFEEGQKMTQELGAFNVPSDLLPYLGRFKYRTSFGQNLIVHTMELVKVGVHIAQEIGANVEVVRLGCLFHDIGKNATPRCAQFATPSAIVSASALFCPNSSSCHTVSSSRC